MVYVEAGEEGPNPGAAIQKAAECPEWTVDVDTPIGLRADDIDETTPVFGLEVRPPDLGDQTGCVPTVGALVHRAPGLWFREVTVVSGDAPAGPDGDDGEPGRSGEDGAGAIDAIPPVGTGYPFDGGDADPSTDSGGEPDVHFHGGYSDQLVAGPGQGGGTAESTGKLTLAPDGCQ